MKKIIGLFLVALIGFAVMAQADTATVSLSVTNGQAISYSDAIPASGILDRIEVIQSDATATSTVTVATYSGTTAVDTLAGLTALVGNKVVRPRIIGTTTAGVNLAGVPVDTNAVTTVLMAPYEKPMVGGNLKMAVTGTFNAGTNTVTAKLYFTPVSK